MVNPLPRYKSIHPNPSGSSIMSKIRRFYVGWFFFSRFNFRKCSRLDFERARHFQGNRQTQLGHRLWSMIFHISCHWTGGGGWDAHSILTFPIMHHSPSKHWQHTGTSNIVLLPSFTHPTQALRVCKKKHSPDSGAEGNPGQSIMLCLLMIDSCIRATITRERQQAWKGVDQLSAVGGLRDCRAVIRIFNQDFQDSSCYGRWGRGKKSAEAYSSISPAFPSPISQVKS